MASDNRGSLRHLEFLRELSDAPYKFDFYGALRRIECVFPERPRLGESRRLQDDPIRFGQEPSLEFAPSTLARVARGENGRPDRLLQNFFGVTGPNGPLPLHLTEFLRDRMRNFGDRTISAFLDTFHHRFISLFYRAWARAQPTVSLDRKDNDRFSIYLGSMVGLTQRTMRGRDTVPDHAKLAFAGLLGRQSRSREALAQILEGFMRVPVQVEPFSGHWMDLPEELRPRLGQGEGLLLGQTGVIGVKVWDLQSKFRIAIGPLTLEQYKRFLPGNQSQQRLRDWVRNYIGLELKWDFRLVLRQEQVPTLVLGHGGQLGWTTWLGTRLADTDAGDLVLSGR